jgi:CubicO group peptidase (beta-lactamase class C family)
VWGIDCWVVPNALRLDGFACAVSLPEAPDVLQLILLSNRIMVILNRCRRKLSCAAQKDAEFYITPITPSRFRTFSIKMYASVLIAGGDYELEGSFPFLPDRPCVVRMACTRTGSWRRHMNRKALLVISLLLLCGRVLTAQDVTLAPGDPAGSGMDGSILKAAVQLLKEAVDKDTLRSAVLLVARHGRIVLHEAVGWKDKARGIPIKKDAMFRMASNTKPVIAAGIGILVEEGKLRYGDNVRKYIPAFDNYRSGAITVHHLLTHTSGFRIGPIFFSPLIQESPEHPDAPSLRLEVDRFGEVGADEPVGKTYSYSNAGFNTLGALIEIVSKQPLEQFLKEHIYSPLGMDDTYHHEVAEKLEGKLDRMSVVYYRRQGEWVEGWKPGDPPQYPFVRASGGMISTAMNYAAFCQMFLNKGIYGGKRILREETIKLMTYPHTASLYTQEERQHRREYYGYGWNVSSEGVFSHGGSDGTNAWIDPANNLIVLLFTQSPGEEKLPNRTFQLVEASIQ